MGPAHDYNEYYQGFFQPDAGNEGEEDRSRFSAAIIADVVGGHAHGKVSSRGCKRKGESLVKNKKKKRHGFHGFSLIIFIEIRVNQCNPWRFWSYLLTLTSVYTRQQALCLRSGITSIP
jgi:hypothetical protein